MTVDEVCTAQRKGKQWGKDEGTCGRSFSVFYNQLTISGALPAKIKLQLGGTHIEVRRLQ